MSDILRETFARTMLEVGLEDEKLVVLVGDIGHFALQPFAKACPGRYYNVGILEPTIVSMSAGLAHAGLYPVAHTIAPFLIERSFEQIKLDFCYQGFGGTLITVGSAFDYSTLGCSHHCYDDFALIGSLPGTEIIYPASAREFELLFRETYRNGKLTYFRLPKENHGCILEDSDIALGRGVAMRQGRDLTIATCGPQLATALAAAELLAGQGIEAEVLYFPTVKPFDDAFLREHVSKTRRMLCIEEHVAHGGLGDRALRGVRHIPGLISDFICIPDEFQRGYGEYADHCNKLGFTATAIVERAHWLCSQGSINDK